MDKLKKFIRSIILESNKAVSKLEIEYQSTKTKEKREDIWKLITILTENNQLLLSVCLLAKSELKNFRYEIKKSTEQNDKISKFINEKKYYYQ